MLALRMPPKARQVIGAGPDVLGEVLHHGVNLALWQRRLPVQIEDFVTLLLAQNEPVAESLTLNLESDEQPLELPSLLLGYADLLGREAFIADVVWLVRAFACLVDARRIGLRLRALDKAMCPRFHVDHVPLRLITCYAGIGTQWLEEGAMPRAGLGSAVAEPDASVVRHSEPGHVLLAKGEKWLGNEGAGLIHRSPAPAPGERRLLLTLDWLA
ncbi:DUF1826 domain-containing protein [Pseudomonas sp. LRF_L74]|uniref:DUF1826 domain-containing protein n=1 Tax=Pseudomonas sp. LRF_L74 TaxID=3369422 RepID=UPI003F6164C9